MSVLIMTGAKEEKLSASDKTQKRVQKNILNTESNSC